MCGSSGPSAEQLYQEMKPEFGPLPSLSMNADGPLRGRAPKYGNVKTGQERRSLLAPMLLQGK